MTGIATPQVLVQAFAQNAPAVSAPNGTLGAKTAPFPAPSQVGVLNGAASLNDGFPPLTFTAPTSGGQAVFGADMNGALFAISAPVVFLMAGQRPAFSATLAASMGGYALGAVVSNAADPTSYWTNNEDGNATDPAVSSAQWILSKPIYETPAIPSGNNYALPGPSDFIFDVSTASGNIVLNGIVAQRDGQKVTFRKSTNDGNTFTLGVGAGSAGNQVQASGPLTCANQYDTWTVQFNKTLNAWFTP